jgi:mono/diheme cytochrome c family protein
MTTQRSAPVAGLAGLMFVVAAAGAHAQQSAAADRGNTKYQYMCATCHGAGPGDDGRAMLPGTDALRIKYKGRLPALLEARTDLTAKTLKTVVRRGTWSMPPFRQTEITDAEIEDIAAYLAKAPKAAPRASGSQR